MRLDVITIFPEYLDPFRHALLGKAIEKNILRSAYTTFGTGRQTCINPSTTRPTAEDLAWS